ncbi:MAG: efflux RND transporter periplasmic adaptor subunit [Caulobacteraceae bacterium]|nr:efflux RND transporter periplasmic adaptor subunit [Caulobacteraceae bacterium]
MRSSLMPQCLGRLPLAHLPILALALTLGLAGCRKAAPSGGGAEPRTVTVTEVALRTLPGGVDAPGTLVSREEAAVNSELAGYRVAKVYVEADAMVKKDQPLAQLDDALLRAQIAQQTALVAQQKVAADQAAEQAAHVAGLDGQGVLSTEQIDQRRFQAQSAKAGLDAQDAALRDLETREARMTIRAPVAGLVLQRNVRPGDLSTAGATPMFTMARDDLIELEADVAETDLFGIKVGDAVRVTLPDDKVVQGVVRLVMPSIDQQTKLGKVRVSLPASRNLRPGGFGRASFTGSTRLVAAAPETAVRYDADGASVMVVDSNDRVRRAMVVTGQHAGGYVELIKGPPPGARVLRSAAVFVLEGDPVRPIGDDAPAGRP